MSDKITLQELRDLFGAEIPMTVMDIIWNSPPTTTVDFIRQKIIELAKQPMHPTALRLVWNKAPAEDTQRYGVLYKCILLGLEYQISSADEDEQACIVYRHKPDFENLNAGLGLLNLEKCKELAAQDALRQWRQERVKHTLAQEAAVKPQAIVSTVMLSEDDIAELDKLLIIECERAIKQQNNWLQTKVSTASHGGSHDTCFGTIMREFFKKHAIDLNKAHPDSFAHAVHFVARWAWRNDPPHANRKLTDAERFSVIKHYPLIKNLGQDYVVKD